MIDVYDSDSLGIDYKLLHLKQSKKAIALLNNLLEEIVCDHG